MVDTIAKKKRGRPPSGSVKFINGTWSARITYADGSRHWVELDPAIPEHDRERARAEARTVAHLARERGVVAPTNEETFDEYAGRWLADRAGRIVSIRDDRAHLRLYVLPKLGPLAIDKLTREHVEDVVADLDRRVCLPTGHADRLSWKTALNIWSTFRKCLDDAAHGKKRALRVLTESPAAGVHGPDRGRKKARQFLYPSEFLQFVSCELVPLRWRRVVTVAVYLYARDGELRVIEWGDGTLDLDRGVATIHKAWDRRAQLVKTPKSGMARNVGIESNLLPLLAAMHDEASGEGRVLPRPSDRDLSRGLKRWLKKAGITRRQLFEETETTHGLTFHDLRATGITWLAVRGDPHARIMSWAGHSRHETTQGYIRTADALRPQFGEPFPELPFQALGISAEFRPEAEMRNAEGVTPSAFLVSKLRGGRDSNPRPPA